jgi:hypothetical protein
MRKIVFLGDSLLDDIWTELFSQDIGLGYVNLAVSAGNNNTQIHRLLHYINSDQYCADDIFFWEINDITRENICYYHSEVEVDRRREFEYWSRVSDLQMQNESSVAGLKFLSDMSNNFTDKISVLLCHDTKEHQRRQLDRYGLCNIREIVLQDLLGLIKMLATNHTVVTTLGWDSSIPDTYRDEFLKILNNTDAVYIGESILDWCVYQGLALKDDLHPTTVSTLIWSSTFLKPIIQQTLKE